MKNALLIHEQPGPYDGFDAEQRAAVAGEYVAIGEDRRVVGGARLMPAETATTVRVENDEALITDGPFADTK